MRVSRLSLLVLAVIAAAEFTLPEQLPAQEFAAGYCQVNDATNGFGRAGPVNADETVGSVN